MIDPQVPPDQRANLTPEDLRDYYLEMGHRELALVKERDQLRRQVKDLMGEITTILQQRDEARAGFEAAERRILDLELRVRNLTQSLLETRL